MKNKTHITEEHIYRWECPECGHHNTAYYKEVPEMLQCMNCAGCYYQCRKEEAEMIRNADGSGCKPEPAFDTPLTPLGFVVSAQSNDRGELYDLERMNFLAWYRDATVEEIAIARRNNAAKLDELKKKYASEIELMDIVGRPA